MFSAEHDEPREWWASAMAEVVAVAAWVDASRKLAMFRA